MSAGAAGPAVAVCVATFRRPALLGALLASLGRLEPGGRRPRVKVFVVDNDRGASARAVVEEARGELPFPVEYLCEPERNISLARNRGVARALAWGAGWVAFVDDDEVVRPDWLGELLAVQARTGADVVSGAVVPRFPAGAPRWAGRSGVFAQLHASDGAPVSYAATNNVLVAARLLRREGEGPFDPAFGLSGSGDSHFFLRCAREGARMVAAAGAVAEESVPPARVRLGWVLRRAFRVGNGAVFCERALPRAQRRLGLRLAKSSARAAAAAVALPLAPLLGSGAVVRALWHLGRGAGCAAALGGYRYHEYRDGGSSGGGEREESS